MVKLDISGAKHIHFIGIGGSGMFPLAQILHARGYYITGSDNNPSDTLELVKSLGIPVYMGQRAENIAGADLIVHTAAIMADNEELIAAKASGVPVVERSVLLGYITSQYKNAICVSGTHGKTTTTAMLTQILLESGIDPTAVIGGKLPLIGGNGRVGKSEVMVCEACEFVDTFLKLAPDTTVILNIDEDHMDYFKTMDNLIASFHRFCEMTTHSLIVNGDDSNTLRAIEGISLPTVRFGFNAGNDYRCDNIQTHEGIHQSFDIFKGDDLLDRFDIYIPGRHNVLNATAAVISALQAGAILDGIKQGLAGFKGAGRRFEQLAHINGITIVDDYAHHPAELEVTLKAAKAMPFKRVIAVHQPFTYSRTKLHLDYFARVLALADKVVLSEIMGSREKNTYGICAKDLCDKIPDAVWFNTFEEIADFVCDFARPGDLIITMGCGDIYKAAKLIKKRME